MSILVLTSDTLIGTPATGNLEYNGQFFGTDSNASRAQMQRITQGTAVTASGTSVDFTGLPAWIKRLTITLSGVSSSGSSNQLFQLGTTSGILSSTYTAGAITGGAGSSGANYTTGIGTTLNGASDIKHGQIIFSLHNSSTNLWVASGILVLSNAGFASVVGGSVTLPSALTSVRCTHVNGTDTFDAGSINIMYEG